jgi:hypothetical protein
MVHIFVGVRVQSDGIIGHIEVQGCCKSETVLLLQDCAHFR